MGGSVGQGGDQDRSFVSVISFISDFSLDGLWLDVHLLREKE